MVELHGPFEEATWTLTVDGYQVPDVHVVRRQTAPEWSVVVDNRFATEWISKDEIGRWAYVLANYGAIHAGYSCHGEHSAPLNRFKCRVGRVSSDDMARIHRSGIDVVPE